MSKHFQYLRYVLRHKWFVFIECCRMRIPLRGFVHDWSKFLPDEWFPYVNHFYGSGTAEQKHGLGDKKFDLAWLKHQHRNRHHWQWYLLFEDDGGRIPLPMTEKAIRTMIADWRGASRAQGRGDNTMEWYKAHANIMCLDCRTRRRIEQILVSGTVETQSGFPEGR